MADLGNLNFGIHLKDYTPQEYEAIKKKLVNMHATVSARVGLKTDVKEIEEKVEALLKNKTYKVKLEVDSESIKSFTEAFKGKGMTSDELRGIKGFATTVRMDADVTYKKVLQDIRREREQLDASIKKEREQLNASLKRGREQSEAVLRATQAASSIIRADAYANSQMKRTDAYVNSQKALEQLRNARMQAAKASDTHNAAMKRANSTMSSQSRIAGELKNQIANVYSIYTVERFVRGLYTIGGEFQKQRIALTSILGDSMKAETIFNRIKDLAVVSPFQFKELASYTKQLSAYSIPYEELYDTTKRLADISAGVGVDMGRIILAYGQVRSAAFLRGQELRQFTEAGIPLVDELAKRFTILENKVVSAGDIFDKISRKEVSFGMVKDVLWDLTNEGGKFYNMQEALAESLAGKWSNLQDAWDVMMADIAESNSGVLSDNLELLTKLMNNWEKIVRVLGAVVTAYGAYKGGILLANILTAKSIASHYTLAGAAGMATQRLAGEAAAMGMMNKQTAQMIVGVNSLKVSFASLSKLNIFTMTLSALAGGVFYLHSAYTEANKLNNELNEITSKASLTAQNDIDVYKMLVNQLGNVKNSSKEYDEIIQKIQSRYGSYIGNIQSESDAYEVLKNKINDVTIALKNKAAENARQQGISRIEEDYSQDIAEYSQKLTKSLIEEGGLSKGVAEAITASFREKLPDIISKGGSIYMLLESLFKESGIEGSVSKIVEERASGFTDSYYDAIALSAKKLSVAYTAMKRETADFENTINNLLGYTPKKDTIEETIEGWRKSVKDFIGESKELSRFIPKEDETRENWIENVLSQYNQLIERRKEINELSKSSPFLIDKNELKTVESSIKEVKPLIDFFNLLSLSSFNKNKSAADPIAEQWKDRADLISKALSLYDKWKKIEGEEAASQRVKGVSEFAPIFDKNGVNLDLSDPSKAYQYIQDQLDQSKGKQMELYLSLGVKKENINYDNVKKGVDDALKEIEKYISESGKKWDLYRQLFDITGNKEQSMSIAFGGEIGFDNLIDELKAKLKREARAYSDMPVDIVLGLDEKTIREKFGKSANVILSLQKEINDKIQEKQNLSLIDEQNTIMEFASIEKKIEAIRAKYQELIDSATTQEGKEAYTQKMNKEIQELNNESIKLLPLWQKLFGETANMGYNNLRKLVDEAKKFSESAVEQKDPITRKSQFELIDNDDKKHILSLEEYLRLLEQIEKIQNDLNSQNPFQGVIDGFEKLKRAKGADEQQEALKMIGSNANVAAQMIKGVTDAWSGMFDALGNDELADTLGLVGELTGEIGNLVEGLTSGNPVQMATSTLSFIPNIIGSIARAHDKRLDKAIQRSQLEVQKLSNTYKNLQSVVERQLGSVTQSQSKEMIGNLQAQRREIEKQIEAERDKKKSDASKIEDYKQQIIELDEQLKYFYEDLAGEQFGIDLKGWADQISEALVGAFANGEDAAIAFDNTVADIMRSVIKNMISLGVIQPAMEKLREYLFGKTGIFTDNSAGGTDLTQQEASGLLQEIEKLKGTISDSQKIWDYLNEAAKKAGISLEDTTSSNGLSKGIEGVTEDTANLLGSYINGIRLDVSVKRALLEKIGNDILPKYNVLAEAQLTQLRAIADNTLRSAQNTEANVAVLQEVRDMFNMVINKGERKIRI